MLVMTIIGLVFGAWTFTFLMMEINDLWEAKTFNGKLRNTWNLFVDILLTIGMTTIFSLGAGMMGTMLGLMASGFVSTFLFTKRRKRA